MNLVCKGCDISNAFAEALAPNYEFYMKPDAQFRQCRTECFGNEPLERDDIIPIRHALEGHPESSRLLDKYILKILIKDFKFKACIHQSCLYYKMDDDNNLSLIVQVVDDLVICNKDIKVCDQWANKLQEKMTFPLNSLSTVRKFNGVDIDQICNYSHIHCVSYINKIIQHHN